MIIRIRHERLSIALTLIAVFQLLCILAFVFLVKDMLPGAICTLILLLVTIILFVLEQTVKTAVAVEEDAVTVRHLFLKKRIEVSEIRDVRLERYTRSHKNHYKEQRLRMTVSGVSGQKIVLTDSAMAERGGIQFSRYAVLPDEEVPLYEIYQRIQEMLRT